MKWKSIAVTALISILAVMAYNRFLSDKTGITA